MARFIVTGGLLLGLALGFCGAARAQSIVATINGDPVTTVDLAERQKILHALGAAADAPTPLESLVRSRVMAGEVNKFGIKVKPEELGPTYYALAEKAHVTPQAMQQRLAASGANKQHLENFLEIIQAFAIYARARNRAVEVSEAQIQAEINRDPKLKNEMSYTIRQIALGVPPESGVAGLQAGAKQMDSLRARFTSCESGVKIANETPNVVVRDAMTRTSSQLGDQLSGLLDKTAVGHLTPTSRDAGGLVALALCAREHAHVESAREVAQQRIMAKAIQADAEKLYKELRATAIIVKK